MKENLIIIELKMHFVETCDIENDFKVTFCNSNEIKF